MIKDVVVMPTLHRPEMLALALEKLEKTPEANQIDVRIFLDCSDAHRLDEVNYVRDLYFPQAEIFQANPHAIAPGGCWNILNALKQGYETGARHIFLVEEDVMVKPNFFQWHLTVQQYLSPRYFATCGRRVEAYPSDFYTNPGSCFNRDSLTLVVPHICPEFFVDRRGYMDDRFGPMDEASDLDDGLIRRVIRSVHGSVCYPLTPVVAHQGFRSYGRLAGYTVDQGVPIQERIEQLRQMIPTIKSTDRYTKDFEA